MRTIGDRLVVDGLVVEDECAVRLVREREQNGDDPVRVVRDAVEIGARVLDREQAGANAEFVKTEFEKASQGRAAGVRREARARVAEFFETQFAEVFGGSDGQLAKELERRFGDGSAVSVQNRVREAVAETLAEVARGPGAPVLGGRRAQPARRLQERGAVREIQQAAEQRRTRLSGRCSQKLGELQKELQALRDEKDKLEEVEAERERGTAKGRTFEEAVAEAVDRIALAQGDDAEAVGDVTEATGKVGDIVVVASTPATARRAAAIVFEAKDRRLSQPEGAARSSTRRMASARADFAVLVVPTEEELPAKLQPLREYNGDKMVVALGPGGRGPLRARDTPTGCARARVLMKRSDADGHRRRARPVERGRAERAARRAL